MQQFDYASLLLSNSAKNIHHFFENEFDITYSINFIPMLLVVTLAFVRSNILLNLYQKFVTKVCQLCYQSGSKLSGCVVTGEEDRRS